VIVRTDVSVDCIADALQMISSQTGLMLRGSLLARAKSRKLILGEACEQCGSTHWPSLIVLLRAVRLARRQKIFFDTYSARQSEMLIWASRVKAIPRRPSAEPDDISNRLPSHSRFHLNPSSCGTIVLLKKQLSYACRIRHPPVNPPCPS
jgi:hypothetical protein